MKFDAALAALLSVCFAIDNVLVGSLLGHGKWQLALDCFTGAYYLVLLYRLGTFKELFS